MKQLILIRHAKSSWDDPALPDNERPLNARGEKASKKMGTYLFESWYDIWEIHSSPALRAVLTAENISASFTEISMILSESLYVFSNISNPVLDYVSRVQTSQDTLTIVGHNECLRDLVMQLSQWQVMRFPTCAVAMFAFDIEEWGDIFEDRYPDLVEYVTPKEMRDCHVAWSSTRALLLAMTQNP